MLFYDDCSNSPVVAPAVVGCAEAVAAALLRALAMLVYAGFLTRLEDHKSASPEPEKVEGTQEYLTITMLA